MIIFGTSSSTIHPAKLDGGCCPFCKTKNQMWIQGYRKYFHVFWIPFFPLWKKVYSVCSHCKGAFEKKEFKNQELISSFEHFENNKIKIPWYHFTGIILVVLLIMLISILPFLTK
ncbi:zinc-ribbon domain-containing protein [uncultured Aquimarina sp.]|uniref:zinc-ribbon domain-containing protein n=1 Tax=uncultured Aquimarina sp. TaxID=575652 RepID=UPI00260CB8B5|nr:zinc-ribbon domain-containing protein [uncultured Aquimarina sp.]